MLKHFPVKIIICTILFLSFVLSCLSQNGRIISCVPYNYHDTDVVKLKKRYNAAYDSIGSQTSLQKITYLSDGLKIAGFIAYPALINEKLPCIIYCRGGNREFGSLAAGELFYLQRMASWGYVVIASQYRGCCGSDGNDEFGGDDINDVLNLLPALAQVPQADTSKIGIHGWSRGGMMAYLSLKYSGRFKAAAVGAGAANLYNGITMRKDSFELYVYAELIPGYYKNKDKELRKRSAVYWADSLCKTTPVLLLQGSSDWRVSPEESLELVNKLYMAKQPLKFILYPGGDHGLREYRTETDEEIKKWFDEYLKNNKPLPNMEKHGR